MNQAAVLVVVLASVSVELAWTPPGLVSYDPDRRGGADQRDRLGAHVEALQRGPVVRAPAPWLTETPKVCRNQRLKSHPQLIGHNLLAHAMILKRSAPHAKPPHQLILN